MKSVKAIIFIFSKENILQLKQIEIDLYKCFILKNTELLDVPTCIWIKQLEKCQICSNFKESLQNPKAKYNKSI